MPCTVVDASDGGWDCLDFKADLAVREQSIAAAAIIVNLSLFFCHPSESTTKLLIGRLRQKPQLPD